METLAKTKLLTVLGHELREPLAPALAEIELLMMEPHATSCYESLAAVKKHIEREAQLISTLLDRLEVTAPGESRFPLPQNGCTKTSAKPRILLVEDHADTRDVLQRVLWNEGYRVQPAATVQQAIVEARAGDFLVCDLGLPDGEGYDVMRALAPMGVQGIAVSGFGSREDQEMSRESGFRTHLTKPIDVKTMLLTIQKYAVCGAGKN